MMKGYMQTEQWLIIGGILLVLCSTVWSCSWGQSPKPPSRMAATAASSSEVIEGKASLSEPVGPLEAQWASCLAESGCPGWLRPPTSGCYALVMSPEFALLTNPHRNRLVEEHLEVFRAWPSVDVADYLVAMQVLAQAGYADVGAASLRMLSAAEPLSVENAALALGSLRYAEAVRPLIGLLDDRSGFPSPAWEMECGWPPDWQRTPVPAAHYAGQGVIRNAVTAAAALGSIGSAEAVGPLSDRLRDRDCTFRCIAADSLGKIGDPRALSVLQAVLDEAQAAGDLLLAHWTRRALLQIQARSKPIDEVVRDLASDDILTRYVAVQILGESGDASALPALKRIEDDTQVIVTNATLPLEVRTVGHAATMATQAIRERAHQAGEDAARASR